jgi:hypothetical protein
MQGLKTGIESIESFMWLRTGSAAWTLVIRQLLGGDNSRVRLAGYKVWKKRELRG